MISHFDKVKQDGAGQFHFWSGTSFFFLLFSLAGFASAVDYVSVLDDSILYDTPSLKGKKLYVVSRYLPMEKIIGLDNWVKVRDSSGSMAWIEKRALSNQRFVVVTSPDATLHLSAEEKSTVVARIKQHVVIEWLESTGTGWIKVRHTEGATGYVKSTEVWGN